MYQVDTENQRKLGMSSLQSSNTFQNSVVSWTVPKEFRFKHLYKKSANDSIYNIPSTKNLRYTTMGFGKKWCIKPKTTPSPDTYTLPSSFSKERARSLGTKTLLNV